MGVDQPLRLGGSHREQFTAIWNSQFMTKMQSCSKKIKEFFFLLSQSSFIGLEYWPKIILLTEIGKSDLRID